LLAFASTHVDLQDAGKPRQMALDAFAAAAVLEAIGNTNSCRSRAIVDGRDETCVDALAVGSRNNERHRMRHCVGLHLIFDGHPGLSDGAGRR
jgi:hypothetical protein